MTPAQRLAALINDIVSCADEADGGKEDARRLCLQLVAALRAEPQTAAPAPTPDDEAPNYQTEENYRKLVTCQRPHDFQGGSVARPRRDPRCMKCDGSVTHDAAAWYRLGLADAPTGADSRAKISGAGEALEAPQPAPHQQRPFGDG